MGKSFEQIGIDHSLPFIAVIMEKGDAGIHPEFRLPEGFSFSFFQPGDEERWAQLQLSVEHVDTLQQAEDIFRQEFLLDCAAGGTPFASAFGGAKIRRRLSRILAYRKLSALSALSFAALALGIAYVLLTNAA